MNFIEQICIDLGLVENIGKDQLQQDNLALETFAELKQLITLLKADKVHEFLDPIVRNRKYPSLRSNVIVQILQKYVILFWFCVLFCVGSRSLLPRGGNLKI